MAPTPNMTIVPNQWPTRPALRRVALVGESPGERECNTGLPFQGPSGQLLNTFLAHAGIDREACLVANVCQSQPPGNKIELFKWDGPEIQSGLAQLTLDMARFQPQFILCLGGTALRAFKGVKVSIDDYRGTLFLAGAVAPGVKCMATFHPARVLREFGLTGICRFDYKRAAEEARTDELFVPVRHIRLLMPEGKGFDA